MGERSRRRVRDLVTQLAFEGLSENEIGRARISMMAKSDLLHARAGYRSARPTTVQKIQLATHGRSIQMGQSRRLTVCLRLPVFPRKRTSRRAGVRRGDADTVASRRCSASAAV